MTGTYMNSLTIQNYKNYKNENTSSKNQKALVRTDWLSIIVRRKKAYVVLKTKSWVFLKTNTIQQGVI